MQYHHGNLRQQLIICAYDWISANGVESISLRKIAAIAHVSQTAPYRHFDSKEHLLAEVATMGFDNFSLAMSNNKTTDDPAEDLVRCGVTYIEFGVNNEHIIDLMFNYPIKKTDFPNLLAAADKAFGMLLQRLQYLHQGNEDSVRLNSISMHAYVHGLLTIMQMNQRIESSATSDFYAASSALQDNLEKMLGSFIKSLDYS
jgi:AcrR family transcriptional regulator